MRRFVPPDFEPPRELRTGDFRLEPRGADHNDRDFAAWTSSIDHIRATPGFAGRTWPHEMSLAENLGDLERHAADFAAREGFTFTVLDPRDDDVVGCVYIYPDDADPTVTTVRSWVRASHAYLDRPLHDALRAWLAEAWPFERIAYAERT